jgi:hypothetical protein
VERAGGSPESALARSSSIGPIYFVHPDVEARWSDLRHGARPPASELIERYEAGADSWTVVTFVELARRGYPVTLSPTFVPGAVCVAHNDHVEPDGRSAHSFVVAIRADRPRTFICDWQVVQSPSSKLWISKRDYYIPFWPQPNIIPRIESRGNRVENLVYMGEQRNLAARFRTRDFEDQLARLGVRLKVRGRDQWQDYSDADLVLAVRDGTRHFLASKPATKLFNAWQAGVPALVGEEQAFAHVRKNDLDYVQVQDVEDVVQAIKRFRADPVLYRSMISNGQARGQEFSLDRISMEWAQFLFAVIQPSYLRWRERSDSTVRARSYQRRLLLRKLFGQRYNRGYDEAGNKITLAHRIASRLRR